MSNSDTDFSEIDRMDDPRSAIQEMDTVREQIGIQQLKRRALDRLAPKAGETFIDIGCGSGEDVRMLASALQSRGRVIGLDSSSTMIEEAKKRTPRNLAITEFLTCDVHQLNFPDDSVDGCWCERTLQHVQDPRQVVGEIRRVLRPQGRTVLLDTDWETFIINAEDRGLTRKILNAFCDMISDGWIGRKLPAIAASSGLIVNEVFTETVHGFDDELLFNTLHFGKFLNALVAGEILSAAEAKRWVSDVKAAKSRGEFFFAVTIFAAFCSKNS